MFSVSFILFSHLDSDPQPCRTLHAYCICRSQNERFKLQWNTFWLLKAVPGSKLKTDYYVYITIIYYILYILLYVCIFGQCLFQSPNVCGGRRLRQGANSRGGQPSVHSSRAQAPGNRVGQTFFSKERNFLAFFCVLYKRTFRSLHSFPFFMWKWFNTIRL